MTLNTHISLDGENIDITLHHYIFTQPDVYADNPDDYYGIKEMSISIENAEEIAFNRGIAVEELYEMVEQRLTKPRLS